MNIVILEELKTNALYLIHNQSNKFDTYDFYTCLELCDLGKYSVTYTRILLDVFRVDFAKHHNIPDEVTRYNAFINKWCEPSVGIGINVNNTNKGNLTLWRKCWLYFIVNKCDAILKSRKGLTNVDEDSNP